jgi:hypothetical protein
MAELLTRAEEQLVDHLGNTFPTYAAGVHPFLIRNAQFFDPSVRNLTKYSRMANILGSAMKQSPAEIEGNYYALPVEQRKLVLANGDVVTLSDNDVDAMLVAGMAVSLQKVLSSSPISAENLRQIDSYQRKGWAIILTLRRDHFAQVASDIYGNASMAEDPEIFTAVNTSEALPVFLARRNFTSLDQMVAFEASIRKLLDSPDYAELLQQKFPEDQINDANQIDAYFKRLSLKKPFKDFTNDEKSKFKAALDLLDGANRVRNSIIRAAVFDHLYPDIPQLADARKLVMQRLALPDNYRPMPKDGYENFDLSKIGVIILDSIISNFSVMTDVTEHIVQYVK